MDTENISREFKRNIGLTNYLNFLKQRLGWLHESEIVYPFKLHANFFSFFPKRFIRLLKINTLRWSYLSDIKSVLFHSRAIAIYFDLDTFKEIENLKEALLKFNKLLEEYYKFQFNDNKRDYKIIFDCLCEQIDRYVSDYDEFHLTFYILLYPNTFRGDIFYYEYRTYDGDSYEFKLFLENYYHISYDKLIEFKKIFRDIELRNKSSFMDKLIRKLKYSLALPSKRNKKKKKYIMQTKYC